MLLKIGFKATLPLAATAGLVGYMMYMNGGDPAATAAHLVTTGTNGAITVPSSSSSGAQAGYPRKSFGESVNDTFSSTLGKARQKMADVGSKVTSGPGSDAPKRGAVAYRWRDSSGGVQFGTHPPADATEVREVSLASASGSAPRAQAAKRAKPAVLQQLPRGLDHSDLLQHLSAPD